MSTVLADGERFDLFMITPHNVYTDQDIVKQIEAKGWEILDFRPPKRGEMVVYSKIGEKGWVVRETNAPCRLPYYIVRKKKVIKFVVTVLETQERKLHPGEAGIASLLGTLDVRTNNTCYDTGWTFYPVKVERIEETA
jgi:hypothetical protein